MLGGLQISCYAGLAKWCVINTELAVNRGDESDTTGNDGGEGGFGLFRPDRRLGRVKRVDRLENSLFRTLAVQRVRKQRHYSLKREGWATNERRNSNEAGGFATESHAFDVVRQTCA